MIAKVAKIIRNMNMIMYLKQEHITNNTYSKFKDYGRQAWASKHGLASMGKQAWASKHGLASMG